MSQNLELMRKIANQKQEVNLPFSAEQLEKIKENFIEGELQHVDFQKVNLNNLFNEPTI